MIISHKYKFVFVKVPKTGSTSVEYALSSICGPDDVVTPIAPKEAFGFKFPDGHEV